MPDPTLRDRLVGIIVGAIIDGGPVGDHPALIADALLASEEWQTREAIVKAAVNRSELAAQKVLHILTCKDCERLEVDDGRWCNEATAMSRRSLDAVAAEDVALDRLAAVRGTT